ncbi:MAG: FkbM family methyltransferase [Verrucomicrobiota bacterium]
MSEIHKDPDAENGIFQEGELVKDFQRLLKRDGVAIDIGANRGQFAARLLEACPDLLIHCFEPVPDAFRDLQEKHGDNPSVTFQNKAVSKTDGKIPFHVMESDIGSSVLPPIEGASSKWLQLDHVEDVESIRMDTFIESLDKPFIDLLKVDAQGHDLEVCDSAGDYLNPKSIGALLIEVNFRDFYEGQCSFPDLLKFLEAHGYRLGWLYQHRSYDGFVWWADALFLPQLED